MTHSGFKTAQKTVNLGKKENNNKDYRYKQKIHPSYSISSKLISFDYILRTKHGICLNEKNKNYLFYHYVSDQHKNPGLIYFEEHTDEENKIIQEEVNAYYNVGTSQVYCSRDKTKSAHSKELTKNRNRNRQDKMLW